ncbi:MAG: 30S ribosomal protein S6, partial [Muribaculaceae bacterium]|nr:30S ribosomal protein S6 [Muribaculaceae bacterium]
EDVIRAAQASRRLPAVYTRQVKKLAYPIEKKSTGYYVLVEFDGDPTLVKKLETAFRRDDNVMRFLVFRLDKYAAEYAAKRRSLASAPKATTVEPAQTEA